MRKKERMVYILYRMASKSFMIPFVIPWDIILITAIVTFLMIGSSIFYATRKLKDDKIVEIIRKESM